MRSLAHVVAGHRTKWLVLGAWLLLAVLITLPVGFFFSIGFVVAIGILLDTFVVRTIMVAAAVRLVGDRIWWPSTEARGGARAETPRAG